MVTIKCANKENVLEDPEMVEMLKGVLSDGVSTSVAINYLRQKCDIYEVCTNEVAIGYFTSEKINDSGFMECHAYIYPDKRKYSIRALKAIVEYNRERGCGVHTSVLGNFPHVLRILKSIGFSITKVEDSAFTKEGILYPIFHLSN